jgi:NAD+ diphosphatase
LISKVCPDCGKEVFPMIATAVLALVQKGDSVLLARNRNFKTPSFSILAGFLEPGETLEECVRREVLEETSLNVGNVAYFGSQPWPFPSGLMVGFFADYRDGEIHLQEDELVAADFYARDNLPPLLPHPFSLSRRMIDAWRAGQQPAVNACDPPRP